MAKAMFLDVKNAVLVSLPTSLLAPHASIAQRASSLTVNWVAFVAKVVLRGPRRLQVPVEDAKIALLDGFAFIRTMSQTVRPVPLDGETASTVQQAAMLF